MGRSCQRMGCLWGWGCARSVKVPEKTAVAQCVVCSVVWRSVWCVGHSFPIVVTPPNHLCSPEEGRGILLLKDARKWLALAVASYRAGRSSCYFLLSSIKYLLNIAVNYYHCYYYPWHQLDSWAIVESESCEFTESIFSLLTRGSTFLLRNLW